MGKAGVDQDQKFYKLYKGNIGKLGIKKRGKNKGLFYCVLNYKASEI